MVRVVMSRALGKIDVPACFSTGKLDGRREADRPAPDHQYLDLALIHGASIEYANYLSQCGDIRMIQP
jgi:hypothetical protein